MAMRLAAFIEQHMEPILANWEEFASTMLPGSRRMDSRALRDHAQQILEAVAKDMSSFQSRDAQLTKSLGAAPIDMSAPVTAAQTHALLRAKSGFDINQLVAEYRALRSISSRQCIPIDGSIYRLKAMRAVPGMVRDCNSCWVTWLGMQSSTGFRKSQWP